MNIISDVSNRRLLSHRYDKNAAALENKLDEKTAENIRLGGDLVRAEAAKADLERGWRDSLAAEAADRATAADGDAAARSAAGRELDLLKKERRAIQKIFEDKIAGPLDAVADALRHAGPPAALKDVAYLQELVKKTVGALRQTS